MKKLIGFAFVLICMASCKSDSAYNYCKYMLAEEKKLEVGINRTEDAVERYVTAQNFDSVAAEGARMEKEFDMVLAEVKAKPVPDAKDADRFKTEMIRYFDYMKSLYTSYKDFGNAKTPEAQEEVRTRMSDIISKKSEVITRIQSEQRHFADVNNFKVQ